MVTGWRRAFCTSMPKDTEPKALTEIRQHHSDCDNTNNHCPKISSKFTFFSNPSTPQSQTQSQPTLRCRTCSVPNSPKLQQCNNNAKTTNNKHSSPRPRLFHLSTPFLPNSPSSFSLLNLKATLRLSKSRCGICTQSAKTGQGTAIFTAECSHTFHFPCIASHVKEQQILTCPVCSTNWKELIAEENRPARSLKTTSSKLYDDDEPLRSPSSVSRFNPIPESNENEEEEENKEEPSESKFQGFNFNVSSLKTRTIDVCLLPEAAIVGSNRSYETYVAVVKVKALQCNAAARRPPVDLVAVLDGDGTMAEPEKLRILKRSMRVVICSLGSADRLSVVAFSGGGSKRLLQLRRMTGRGQRAARRAVNALAAIERGRDEAPAKHVALKKAAKVLEDRRQKNPVAAVILLSDGRDDRKSSFVCCTRSSHLAIPVHSLRLSEIGACGHVRQDSTFARRIGSLLSVVAQDLRLQLRVASRSAPAEVAAVYSLASGCPAPLSPGSAVLGDLCAAEERELLVELKAPAGTPSRGPHQPHVLSVRSSHRDPFTQEIVYSKERAIIIPLPHTVGSSNPMSERLRNLHVTARAVAESRQLVELNDLSGALHLLSSARALLMQPSNNSADEYLSWIEAEKAELQLRVEKQRLSHKRRSNNCLEERLEPLTPTSAWRAAERLAKVAIMRKSMNRVSDLHGFENARF